MLQIILGACPAPPCNPSERCSITLGSVVRLMGWSVAAVGRTLFMQWCVGTGCCKATSVLTLRLQRQGWDSRRPQRRGPVSDSPMQMHHRPDRSSFRSSPQRLPCPSVRRFPAGARRPPTQARLAIERQQRWRAPTSSSPVAWGSSVRSGRPGWPAGSRERGPAAAGAHPGSPAPSRRTIPTPRQPLSRQPHRAGAAGARLQGLHHGQPGQQLSEGLRPHGGAGGRQGAQHEVHQGWQRAGRVGAGGAAAGASAAARGHDRLAAPLVASACCCTSCRATCATWRTWRRRFRQRSERGSWLG